MNEFRDIIDHRRKSINPEDYESAEVYIAACFRIMPMYPLFASKEEIAEEILDLFIKWNFCHFMKRELLKEIAKDANHEREIGERRKM